MENTHVAHKRRACSNQADKNPSRHRVNKYRHEQFSFAKRTEISNYLGRITTILYARHQAFLFTITWRIQSFIVPRLKEGNWNYPRPLFTVSMSHLVALQRSHVRKIHHLLGIKYDSAASQWSFGHTGICLIFKHDINQKRPYVLYIDMSVIVRGCQSSFWISDDNNRNRKKRGKN